jgi:hypothetical protein
MGQKALTINTFHGRLIQACFSPDISDEEAFLVFIILHLYAIQIPEGLLRDRPKITELAALTQRGASESLAQLWHGTNDERSHYSYWYWRWNGEWGAYGLAENLSQNQKEAHSWVVDLHEED